MTDFDFLLGVKFWADYTISCLFALPAIPVLAKVGFWLTSDDRQVERNENRGILAGLLIALVVFSSIFSYRNFA